jgi:phospholipid/cholesterol/gamma-HCH transport system substrate-binding protein
MIGELAGLGSKADRILGNLEKTSSTVASDSFRDDVAVTMRSLRVIAEEVAEGDGYVHKLLADKAEGERLSSLVENLEHSTQTLDQLLGGANQVVRQVNQGPGLAHAVLYGKEGEQAIKDFAHAGEELALALRGIREGNGLAKSILYGDGESEQLLEDLRAISADIRQVTKDLKDGKGTLGALLTDSSVFEDVKVLLGNVQRNRALRALVRYSIRRDEKVGPVEVTDPRADESPAPASGTVSSEGGISAGSDTSTR